MTDDDAVVAKKKRTLLEKYDIPVSHLTYEYVNKCNDGKELERIVKILRSGEEGLYPDLEKCAAGRLAEIMPSSRVLRVEEPVLRKSMLGVENWNQVNNDLANWSEEMKTKEQELKKAEDSFVAVDLPDVRCEKPTKSAKDKNEVKETKKLKCVVPRDYSEWDKYDPDKEILKMDLEDLKRKEELEKQQRLHDKDAVKKLPMSRSNVVGGPGIYSSTEKQFLATQEKDKGNEYFKAREYNLAVEHYSASIAIDPTPVAYNNRAMAYIKLEQYLEALRDSNKVIELEPNNVKALHRRGIAYKHRGNYNNALDDFLKILQLEPNNRMANSLAQELQAKLDSNRRSVRMHIAEEEGFEDGPKIMEIPDECDIQEPCVQDISAKINTSWPAPPDRRVKCNEFGLPKVMCNCCGVPEWVRRPPPRCLTCKEIKERRKIEEIKVKELETCFKDVETEATHTCEDNVSEEISVCEHTGETDSAPQTIISTSENDAPLYTPNLEAATPEAENTEEKKDTCYDAKGIGDTSCQEEISVSKEAINKSSVAPSPKVKSGRKMEQRRLLPTENIKPVKVQVASKYTTKTVVKGEEETARGVQAIQGLSLEGVGKISTPFEFVNALQAVKGEDSALLAPVLQRIDPSDLNFLIGNKLDDIMLQSILECLRKCFINNGPFVLKFLENLAVLPRFGIVKMFLDSKTKQVIQDLFESLEKQGCELSDRLQEGFKL